jgi:hypothetical protein
MSLLNFSDTIFLKEDVVVGVAAAAIISSMFD